MKTRPSGLNAPVTRIYPYSSYALFGLRCLITTGYEPGALVRNRCYATNRPTMSSEHNEFKGIPKLTVVTYPAWKNAMVMALMSERCYDIVKGNEVVPKAPIPLPGDELSSTPEAKNEYNKTYERYEVRLADYKSPFGKAGWLINQSLTRETEIYVKDTTNPAKMWRILQEKLDSKDNMGL